MVLLFLESIGTTELLVILVVALVVFGPRRLPDLGRKLGKSMAEFRRVSDDFKRTWEREVDLDRYERERTTADRAAPPDEQPPPAALAEASARGPIIAESHNSIARGARPAPAAAYATRTEPDAGTEAGGANVAAGAVNTDPAEQSPRKSDWL